MSSSMNTSVTALPPSSLYTSLVVPLFHHLTDKDDNCSFELLHALNEYSLRSPLWMVSLILQFLRENAKIDMSHKSKILRFLGQIFERGLEFLPQDMATTQPNPSSPSSSVLVVDLIAFLTREILAPEQDDNTLQTVSSQCLNLLSVRFCHSLVVALLASFKPGDLPPYFIVKTLADAAAQNPLKFAEDMKDVLPRFTTIIGNIKKAPYKWVVSTALGRFADCLIQYKSDQDARGQGTTQGGIDCSMFELEFLSCFDVLFTSWLPAPEDKVRFSVAESLGLIGRIIEKNSFESRIPKFLPKYLELMKKEKFASLLPISTGLFHILYQGYNVKTRQFETSLTPLLTLLHSLVSRPVDPSIPSFHKISNEILRVWETLGQGQMDIVLPFIINRFQLKERETRLGSLAILRHFVNSKSLQSYLADKQPYIMSSVVSLLGEPDFAIRKSLLQLIISMSYGDYLTIEGGEAAVKFVVQQGSLNDGEKKEINEEISQLRSAAQHGIFSIAKTPNGRKVLYPLLFEFVCDPNMWRTTVVCFKAIEYIIRNGGKTQPSEQKTTKKVVKKKKKQPAETKENKTDEDGIAVEEDNEEEEEVEEVEAEETLDDSDVTSPVNVDGFQLNWETHVNLPSPQSILLRLFVLCSDPVRRLASQTTPSQTSIESSSVLLKALLCLGPILHPDLGPYFQEAIPSLVSHLHERDPTTLLSAWNKWQDAILKFFKETLNILTPHVKWLQDLAVAGGNSFKFYKADSYAIKTLFRLQGVLLSRIENKSILAGQIDLYFQSIQHKIEVERGGFAQGCGLISVNHLDLVLNKLSDLMNGTGSFAPVAPPPKSGGLFSSFTSSKPAEPGFDENICASVVLSYGFICVYAPSNLLLSRLEVSIIHHLLPLFQKANTISLKINMVKSLELISKSIHPSRLSEEKQGFRLTQRDDILIGLLSMMGTVGAIEEDTSNSNKDAKDNKARASSTSAARPARPVVLNIELRLVLLSCITSYIYLDPLLSEGIKKKIVEVTIAPLGITRQQIQEENKLNPSSGAAQTQGQTGSPTLGPQSSPDGDLNSQMELLLASYGNVLSALLDRNPTLSTLLGFFSFLQSPSYLSSPDPLKRERALDLYLVVAKKFISLLLHEGIQTKEVEIPSLGLHLSHLLVRSSDSSRSIRQTALECIQGLLYICQIVVGRRGKDEGEGEGGVGKEKPIPEIKYLSEIRGKLVESQEFEGRMEVIKELCELLNGLPLIPLEELISLCFALFAGLQDNDEEAARGSGFLLSQLITMRCQELKAKGAISTLLNDSFLTAFRLVKRSTVVVSIQKSFQALCFTHIGLVQRDLIEGRAIPFPKEVNDCVESIGIFENEEEKKKTCQVFFVYLLDLINETPIDPAKPTVNINAAVAALRHLLTLPSLKSLILQTFYARILGTLLLRMGTAIVHKSENTGSKDAAIYTMALQDTTTALRNLFTLCEESDVLYCIDEQKTLTQFESSPTSFDDSITSIIRFWCSGSLKVSSRQWGVKLELVGVVSKYLTPSAHRGMRIVASSMLAELINHAGVGNNNEDQKEEHTVDSVSSSDLLRELIRHLLPRVVDPTDKVRKQSMRGLGNLGAVWGPETIEMGASILSSLTAAAEDKNEEVAAESVKSLTKLCSVLSHSTIEPQLLSICYRLRPSFTRKDDSVRSAAFQLFGSLCKFGRSGSGNGSLNENFIDQIHTTIFIFFAHLADESAAVRRESGRNLPKLAELLMESLGAMASEEIESRYNPTSPQGNPAISSSLDDFFSRFAETLLKEFPSQLRVYLDCLSSYLTSKTDSLRAQSGFITACLLRSAHIQSEGIEEFKRGQIHQGFATTISSVIKLLDDPQAYVRAKTAKGVSLLKDF